MKELQGQVGDLTTAITNGTQLVVKQKRELAEIFLGFETCNKYLVFDQTGLPCGAVIEQGGGIGGFLRRLILRSHRGFEMHVIDSKGQVLLKFKRKFFFLFSDVSVFAANDEHLGSAKRRFAIIHKIYDLVGRDGQRFARIKSGIFRIWTFAIRDTADREVSRISKKWSGVLKEAFTDADNFLVDFATAQWTPQQRAVILAVAVSIDLDFFDNNND